MRRYLSVMQVLVSIALISCVAAQDAEVSPAAAATKMWVPETGFERARVVAAKSMPPQFTLVMQREMPTPGWTFRIDSLDIDQQHRRIAVQLTEVAPTGITTQVITPTPLELPLGTVEPGHYFVELSTRRAVDQPHEPAHALVVIAR